MDEEDEHFFKCKPPEVHFTIRNRVPYNKLLTNRASSGRTGQYWPLVVFVRTSPRSVRTVTTLGQYSPVRPSRSVSKRLILTALGENLFRIGLRQFAIWPNTEYIFSQLAVNIMWYCCLKIAISLYL